MNVQLLISGISLGSVYALIAVGFAIVFSILKFSNFAHGGMISLCAYLGYFFQRSFEQPPPIFVTILFTAVCGVVVAIVVDTIAYRRIRAKGAPNIYYFLASITVAILIQQILSVFYGKNLYGYPPIFESTTYFIGSIRFSSIDTLIMLVALALLAVLIILIEKTRIGLAIRAVAIDAKTSRLMGMNSNLIILAVFVMAGFLAGVSGVLLGLKYMAYPALGSSMMIKGFIASVIGGLGSLSGAIIAAILLGIIEILLTYHLSSLATPIILFGIMLIFLFVRPEGISGKFAKDKV